MPVVNRLPQMLPNRSNWRNRSQTREMPKTSVIASLERLISELSGSTDVRRLAQRLADLRRDQIAHEQMVRAEIGLDTLPLQLNELSRAQRGKLDKAAAGQSALVTRFENIVQAIDHLAQAQSAQDAAAAETAAHAVELARRLAIATNMQETSRDLSGNRVGQALAREAQIAADLQQVLEALDNTTASRSVSESTSPGRGAFGKASRAGGGSAATNRGGGTAPAQQRRIRSNSANSLAPNKHCSVRPSSLPGS